MKDFDLFNCALFWTPVVCNENFQKYHYANKRENGVKTGQMPKMQKKFVKSGSIKVRKT